FADTVEAIARHDRGEIDRPAFREFIRWRDGVARLDVDSSSYNAHYVDILAEEFSDAQFIFVIRDCWSWLDSMQHGVDHRADDAALDGGALPHHPGAWLCAASRRR